MSNKASKPVKKTTQSVATPSKEFDIKYPLLWLATAVLILYLPTLHFGFTDLDDSIFIRDMKAYNEDISNLITSFHRGVFDAAKDEYYRPLFLDSIILNYQFSEADISGYRLVNILLHLCSALLLFKLLRNLGVKKLHSFLLSLLFAIHPVLSQAVIWIPGRNDTLLTVFVLSYFLFSLDYIKNEKWSSLLLSLLFLICGFFTKETALLAPMAALLLQLLILKQKPFSRSQLIQYATWAAGILIYFSVRFTATLKTSGIALPDMFGAFSGRLPVILQYLGKIILPFNLSVFPIMEDTVYYLGIAAVFIIALLIYFTQKKKWNWYLTGLGFFLTFLLPALLVPKALNEQTFEHRLYLPIIGIFLLLSQTVLFQNKWGDKKTGYASFGVIALFIFLNFNHHKHFKDALSFWEQGYGTSPHSAYATMMYGARVEDKKEGYALMRKAYALNPDEKYLNYYYGVMLQNQDSIAEAEKHFLREKEKSGYYECDYYLAKIAFGKKDYVNAAQYLEDYLEVDKTNEMANNNLLLLYTSELKDKAKAKAQIKRMEENGLFPNQGIKQQVENMP